MNRRCGLLVQPQHATVRRVRVQHNDPVLFGHHQIREAGRAVRLTGGHDHSAVTTYPLAGRGRHRGTGCRIAICTAVTPVVPVKFDRGAPAGDCDEPVMDWIGSASGRRATLQGEGAMGGDCARCKPYDAMPRRHRMIERGNDSLALLVVPRERYCEETDGETKLQGLSRATQSVQHGRCLRKLRSTDCHDSLLSCMAMGLHTTARGHLFLGDPDRAVALHRRSLNTGLGDRNHANYRAHLAAALAVSGDVSSATEEGMTVLTALAGSGIMSPRTLAALQPVRRAAARDCSGKGFCAHYDDIRKPSE